ncbi:hypothetical protein CS542_05610 [Pedobacter sp. IW39]|nr:hypothetical protein CS542_05610 [Pedobacter sp. IW39]
MRAAGLKDTASAAIPAISTMAMQDSLLARNAWIYRLPLFLYRSTDLYRDVAFKCCRDLCIQETQCLIGPIRNQDEQTNFPQKIITY